jgi:hypothetical protein
MLLSYQFLLEKYKFIPKGIIHIGAHHAEECVVYAKNGTENVLWIEGNPELISVIKNNISIFPKNTVYNTLLSDSQKEVEFNITNASMSSSILELCTHLDHYPDIYCTKKLRLKTERFDEFSKINGIEIKNYDFVNLDIQGTELDAIKGMGDILDNINYIYTEINISSLYESCNLLDEMDLYLTSKGFNRVETKLTKQGWGDAFYIRQKISQFEQKNLIKSSQEFINRFKITSSTKKKINIYKKIKVFSYMKALYLKLNRIIFSSRQTIENTEIDNLRKVLQKKSNTEICIFDVGGNFGEYSKICVSLCKKYNIHYRIFIFEPQTSCVSKLNQIFENDQNVKIVPFALSDKVGECNLYKEEDGSSLASIYKRQIFSSVAKEVVKATTIDFFVEKNKINNIHLLKIDTEGHEFKVLKGAKKSFQFIENIQFEYGGTYLDAGNTLKQVFQLLSANYYIGKLNNESIDFLPFLDNMEDYNYANYFAEKIKNN